MLYFVKSQYVTYAMSIKHSVSIFCAITALNWSLFSLFSLCIYAFAAVFLCATVFSVNKDLYNCIGSRSVSTIRAFHFASV